VLKPTNSGLRVLAFDVFGTVVDWHGSIAREVIALGLPVDGHQFAKAWRAGYVPAMQRVAAGELPWMKLDVLHRLILDELLERFEVGEQSEAARQHLNRIWHRLDPWPDSVPGLLRLKRRFTICTLSNGNLGLLSDMARHAGLPWDCLLSAEVFRKYKPDPATYLGVADVFDVQPHQVMMVAAHASDLHAAHALGLHSAYVARPFEYGVMGAPKATPPLPADCLRMRDLEELAEQLDC
jgi:2-haloacid dehalogenase